MANGSFGGGDGTKDAPYLVEDWADFANITDGLKHYKLVNDLDANDYNDGVWTTMKIGFAELDGDGHKIRNIYTTESITLIEFYGVAYTSEAAANRSEMKHLTFENILAPFADVFGKPNINGSDMLKLDCFQIQIQAKCKHMFMTSVSNTQYVTFPCVTFDQSEFSIESESLVDSSRGNNRMFRFQRCYLAISESKCDVNKHPQLQQFDQCRIEGDFTATPKASYYVNWDARNCVLIGTVPIGAGFGFGGIYPSVELPNLVDQTVLGEKAVQGTAGTYIAATTEQCSDVAWLQAQGFLVAQG